MANTRFSAQLQDWLGGSQPKTLHSLGQVFAEKTFAVAFVLLLSLGALPLPTGGVTHLFEIIAMLLALELIIGRRQVWLPRRWRKTELGPRTMGRVLPALLRLVRWLERFSRRHQLPTVRQNFPRLFGVLMLAFALAAFLAPPFSGLDTLPSLGGVVLALGVIMEDALVIGAGVVLGVAGITLDLSLGVTIYRLLPKLL